MVRKLIHQTTQKVNKQDMVERGEKKSQTPQKVQDSKICDTLGCHRFYYLAPLPVLDSMYPEVQNCLPKDYFSAYF